MKVLKINLVSTIAEETGISEKEVSKIFDSTFKVIKRELLIGNSVEIPKYGTFDIKKIKGGYHKNPLTGDYVYIPERVMNFKPSFKF